MNKTNNIPSKRRQNLVSDIWKIIKTIVVIALLVLIRYAVALPMFDFSKIEKQAETKVIRQFKENLLKKTPPRQQTRNEMSWEDFKS